MKIAIVSETSAVEKNKDIVAALAGFEHELLNVGMKGKEDKPELTYIETGFLSALLLNIGRVDLVVGGCGTGQGFLNSVMQYPGVFAGLIQEPSDAWLFAQINGGNCVSLALNKGYGWAGDVNLQFIFEKLFSVEFGCGYPEHRKESQQNSRVRLERLSKVVHLPFDKILEAVDRKILDTVLRFPGVREILDIPNVAAPAVRTVLSNRCGELNLSI